MWRHKLIQEAVIHYIFSLKEKPGIFITVVQWIMKEKHQNPTGSQNPD